MGRLYVCSCKLTHYLVFADASNMRQAMGKESLPFSHDQLASRFAEVEADFKRRVTHVGSISRVASAASAASFKSASRDSASGSASDRGAILIDHLEPPK